VFVQHTSNKVTIRQTSGEFRQESLANA